MKNRWFSSWFTGRGTRAPGAANLREGARGDGGTWLRRHARRKMRIVVWTVLIGLAIGLTELALPAEDAFRAMRAAVRMHPADQSTVVVSIDDRTLNAIKASEPTRTEDARFLNRLFAMGARRVFFDRAYADPTDPQADRAFAAAMAQHRERVYIGAFPDIPQPDGSTEDLLPNPLFRNSAQIVSIMGQEAPFGLSIRLPTASEIEGVVRPSLSAALAGAAAPVGMYRPDFAIDYATIPTVSYIDVLSGKAPASAFAGRDVVVSPSSRAVADYHPIPFRDDVPGVYFHVLGAQTLAHGVPLDLGWLPFLLIAGAVVALQARPQQPNRRLYVATIAAGALAPLALDMGNVSVDVMPGMVALVYGWVRLGRLARSTFHGATDLKLIGAVPAERYAGPVDVFAVKVRNFATIAATLSPDDLDRFLAEISKKIRTVDPDAEIFYARDCFVWSRPSLPSGERDDHVLGLHALLRSNVMIGQRAIDVATSIGIDANVNSPLRERTESAIQGAEDAAHSGRVFRVADVASDEERAWRLQILAELERAIDAGTVSVLFQPKVDLRNKRVAGAEALLRWDHPVRGQLDTGWLIGIAEEHNRVEKLTAFVLDSALAQAREPLAVDPSFKIAINISTLNLSERGFAQKVLQRIAKHGLSAQNVILEITETAPIAASDGSAGVLRELRRAGVHLSVDDFGTGRATMEYLRTIPSDEVKIDRSFVTNMDRSEEDRTLVASAISMAHALGRIAVAEGVETAPVAELVRELGCDQAQGYYFSKPVPMRTLLPMLQRGSIAA